MKKQERGGEMPGGGRSFEAWVEAHKDSGSGNNVSRCWMMVVRSIIAVLYLKIKKMGECRDFVVGVKRKEKRGERKQFLEKHPHPADTVVKHWEGMNKQTIVRVGHVGSLPCPYERSYQSNTLFLLAISHRKHSAILQAKERATDQTNFRSNTATEEPPTHLPMNPSTHLSHGDHMIR